MQIVSQIFRSEKELSFLIEDEIKKSMLNILTSYNIHNKEEIADVFKNLIKTSNFEDIGYLKSIISCDKEAITHEFNLISSRSATIKNYSIEFTSIG